MILTNGTIGANHQEGQGRLHDLHGRAFQAARGISAARQGIIVIISGLVRKRRPSIDVITSSRTIQATNPAIALLRRASSAEG